MIAIAMGLAKITLGREGAWNYDLDSKEKKRRWGGKLIRSNY